MSFKHSYKFKDESERKNTLMEAAFNLAVKNGIDKVTVVDIVNLAETSRVTFYKYFDSVFDIFWEIHRYILDEMTVFLKDNINGQNANEKIHSLFDLYKRLYLERFDDIRFTIFFDCYHTHRADDSNYLDYIFYTYFCDELINEGLEDGSIKESLIFRKKLAIQINAIWGLMQRLSVRKDHIHIETSYDDIEILEGLIETAHIILNIE
ncbi:TetR/AcrR family transcriptional regulator [Clostridium sp. YIM B02505]|uniref:TetR/AcrR family transcriptional regulator n=1 Tax=Clostridium yunnanense TaxID=2800325 RepID=A0ABS1EP64_9CLOT|nr:TetR/AcrR family transcriptional regulator [Clostridium yunnanense]MBK1811171.1 TetR/AcrR family transcriptional regulator [Clostridium yunnanense]